MKATDTAILDRIIEPESVLPADVARVFLQWRFSQADLERMHELLERAKAGKMTKQEKADAASYERIGHFLSILKSKARKSLKA